MLLPLSGSCEVDVDTSTEDPGNGLKLDFGTPSTGGGDNVDDLAVGKDGRRLARGRRSPVPALGAAQSTAKHDHGYLPARVGN